MDVLTLLHPFLRAIHVGVGGVGLALFWLIIALPKGARWHVRCGRLFAKVTWVVGGSALISSVWALVDLDSFAALPTGSEGETLRETYRLIFAILLYLSAATLAGAKLGIEVLRRRARHEELRRTSVPWWLAFTAVTALGLSAFGAWGLAVEPTSGRGLPREAYFIPLLVGGLGLATIVREGRFVFGPAPAPGAWLYKHVWHMCGTGVAFHTAFLVFGANRLLNYRLPGAWALLPWIAPPILGMSLTAWYIRRLRKRAQQESHVWSKRPVVQRVH